MKTLTMRLVLLFTLLATCVAARASERSVVVPEDNTPFTVSQDDVVRLTGHGISGGTITISVSRARQCCFRQRDSAEGQRQDPDRCARQGIRDQAD